MPRNSRHLRRLSAPRFTAPNGLGAPRECLGAPKFRDKLVFSLDLFFSPARLNFARRARRISRPGEEKHLTYVKNHSPAYASRASARRARLSRLSGEYESKGIGSKAASKERPARFMSASHENRGRAREPNPAALQQRLGLRRVSRKMRGLTRAARRVAVC